ncbi:MAG: bifunctional oligoribonuclease/PAP phosphatase NrnA [Bacillota bacterium]|nr:bifunctional oligoribonuclease/PAP phosphatase NrnA [Bacillota bacterium]
MINRSKAVDLLRNNNNFSILTHKSPDGDTLGSAYALCHILQDIGKNARVLVCGEMPKRYDYLRENIIENDFLEEYIVSVDIAADSLLGQLESYIGKINLCIDHHPSNTLTADNILIEGDSAATAEIIYELAKLLGVKITKDIAKCIFTGVTTDTGCFRFANTTAKTHRVAADMIDAGCDGTYINRVMFDTKSRSRLEIERMARETMKFFVDGQCAVIYTTLEMIEKANAIDDDMEGISSIPRQVEGVSVGITMREQEDGSYKVSVRTSDGVNASQICQKFDGGGHQGAAGCTVEGGLEEARAKLVAAAEEIIKNNK